MTNYGIYVKSIESLTICAILKSIQEWVDIKILQITTLGAAYRQKIGKMSDKTTPKHRVSQYETSYQKTTFNGESHIYFCRNVDKRLMFQSHCSYSKGISLSYIGECFKDQVNYQRYRKQITNKILNARKATTVKSRIKNKKFPQISTSNQIRKVFQRQ